MRVMGAPPQRIAEYDQYLESLAPLIRGEEAMVRVAGQERPVRHIMPEAGFVNFEDPIDGLIMLLLMNLHI